MGERLAGRTALVTGAGSGIGRATALQLAREGARVAATDIAAEAAEETAALVRAAGGEAFARRCDVGSSDEVRAAVAAVVAAWGRLDCAVNNAGTEGAVTFLHELDEAAWERTLRINLTGVFLCLKHELAAMLPQGSGSIVNISSVLGVTSFAGGGDYAASKHGVIGLTKTAALEASPLGIRVNAVCPGFVQTAMADRGRAVVGDEAYAQIAQLHALRRLGTAEEIAEAACWLLSDQASFVTGSALLADGGYTAQ